MSETKKEYRRKLRSLRGMELVDAEEKIVERLARFLSGQYNNTLEKRLVDQLNVAEVIGIYSPLLGEPDLRGIFCDWVELSKDREIALPFIDADDVMSYRQWNPSAEGNICRDAKGIISSTGHVVSPSILIIPCVGYSFECFRLGNGGGFFDRYVARVRAADVHAAPFLCGIALDACSVPAEVFDSWDEPLDCILTERKVLFHAA